MQLGGRQNAFTAAVPGNTGVIDADDAGMAIGFVDVTVRFRPVSVTPLMSFTTAVNGSVVFGFTTTLPFTAFAVLMVIVDGGHTEINPAAETVCAIVAVTIVVPGATAVATPEVFSKLTRPGSCAVKVA